MPKKKSKGKVKKTRSYSARFTDAQKDAVIKAYTKGSTLEELATKWKCSTSKIRKALLAAKVEMRPRGPVGDPSKPKAKAKKSKKDMKIAKSKVKKAAKPKASKVKGVVKADIVSTPVPAKTKGLTDEQRARKNERDRARRAAKKAGLNAALASVADTQATA